MAFGGQQMTHPDNGGHRPLDHTHHGEYPQPTEEDQLVPGRKRHPHPRTQTALGRGIATVRSPRRRMALWPG